MDAILAAFSRKDERGTFTACDLVESDEHFLSFVGAHGVDTSRDFTSTVCGQSRLACGPLGSRDRPT